MLVFKILFGPGPGGVHGVAKQGSHNFEKLPKIWPLGLPKRAPGAPKIIFFHSGKKILLFRMFFCENHRKKKKSMVICCLFSD